MATWIIETIAQFGYLGIFLLMLLEAVFPPIPSELIIPFAGFAAQQGFQLGDHGVGIGMLVEQELELGTLELHPVEVGGECLRLRLVDEQAGGGGREAQLAGCLQKFAAAHLAGHEGFEQSFFLIVHTQILR